MAKFRHPEWIEAPVGMTELSVKCDRQSPNGGFIADQMLALPLRMENGQRPRKRLSRHLHTQPAWGSRTARVDILRNHAKARTDLVVTGPDNDAIDQKSAAIMSERRAFDAEQEVRAARCNRNPGCRLTCDPTFNNRQTLSAVEATFSDAEQLGNSMVIVTEAALARYECLLNARGLLP